jgi:serine/threonine protein kinase
MLRSLLSRVRETGRAEQAEPLLPSLPSDGPSEEPAAADDALVGKCLNGTYVVESAIGEGGMGRVYRARHTRLGQKRFAIKVLRSEFMQNSEIVARFRREAETASSISHPNVVGVYDVDTTDDGLAYLVCEFLEGMDLADFLERKTRLDVAMAAHVGIQICRALEAAHERGVLHRDLKPHNVFLLADASGAISPRPPAKVVDFGLSRFMDSGDAQLTRTGIVMGTPSYMSPEQASANPTDHRSDVYGVGAILYTALTGKPPFDAEHLQGLLMAVLTEEPPSPRKSNPAIPETLELVLQRAMAKSPDDRYPSMSELRRALEPFAGSGSAPESADPQQRGATTQDSRDVLASEARTLSRARPKLLFYTGATLFLLVAGLASSLPTLELVTGKLEFTDTELVLVLLAVAGTLLTPGLVLVAHLRVSVWRNHARVLELLDTVRSGLLLAVVIYGAGGLLVRVLDDVVARFHVWPLFGQPPGAAWAGWNALLFLMALLSTLSFATMRRLTRKAQAGLLRVSLARALLVGIPLVALIILYLGFIWRAALG